MLIKLYLQAVNISSSDIWIVELMVIWGFFFMPLCILQVLNYEQYNF